MTINTLKADDRSEWPFDIFKTYPKSTAVEKLMEEE